jgi:hypothetical protein
MILVTVWSTFEHDQFERSICRIVGDEVAFAHELVEIENAFPHMRAEGKSENEKRRMWRDVR